MTSSPSTPWTLLYCTWSSHEASLLSVRVDVFVNEQKVPMELEVDEWDEPSLHLLALDSNSQPIGCGRLVPNETIGRLAVRREWRGKGLGGSLLSSLLDKAKEEGWSQVRLSAQVQAMPFYRKLGFEPYGEEYMDAGIPHMWMRKTLVS